MTRLLFHSYHFPPIGGSGAQRPLKLARYLPEHGYTPVVVTGGGATADRWAPEDTSLMRELSSEMEIHRLEPTDRPETSSRWRGRAERWLALDNAWSRWWTERSTQLGLEAGTDVDLIYVWMQPYDSAAAGAALSKALRKPWVADLGDPWALDEMRVYPSALHRRRDGGVMRRRLATADAIVMSTPEAATRLVSAFPELGRRTVVSIPNGFDAEDFAGVPRPAPDGTFRLVHTGYLHTELGRQLRDTALARRLFRGSFRGLDILTRSHVFLIEAIDRVLARDPSARDVLELHLAGVLNDDDREAAARCPVVHLHGYVTHAESIALLRRADMLFLPMQNLPPGTRATIVPGKTYEYLASGTPILGAVPDGDARDILAAAGNAVLARPDDVAALATALEAALERYRAGRPPPEPDPGVVEEFEYRRLAARLAAVFDGVLAPRSGDLHEPLSLPGRKE